MNPEMLSPQSTRVISPSDNLIQIAQKLKTLDVCAICTHYQPDADTLGAGVALALVLERQGKKAIVYTPGPLLDPFHHYLCNLAEVREGLPEPGAYPAVICVDCSNLDRLDPDDHYDPETELLINIDHHPDNSYFGSDNLVVPNATSTCEIIYDLTVALGLTLDQAIASALYVGIITDTGNFGYASTTPRIHRIVADLLETGIRPEILHGLVYEQLTRETMRLHGLALEGIQTDCEGRLMWTTVTKEMFEQTGTSDADTEGIISKMRQLGTAEILVLFRETEDALTKMSFRAKADYDVGKAAHCFGGGGHRYAAGCRAKRPVAEVRDAVLPVLRDLLCEVG